MLEAARCKPKQVSLDSNTTQRQGKTKVTLWGTMGVRHTHGTCETDAQTPPLKNCRDSSYDFTAVPPGERETPGDGFVRG